MERKYRHILGAVIVVVLASLVSAQWINSTIKLAAVVMLGFLVAVVNQLVWRFCFLLEEICHVRKLCLSGYMEVFKRTLSFNSQSKSVMFVAAIFLACLPNEFKWGTITKTFQELGPIPFCASICAFHILFWITKAEQCTTWQAHTMTDIKGLDYGSGMAHSFFHGYLKIILPSKGDGTPSIRERILAFMEKEQFQDDKFPVKKLVILIPSSGYSFPDLSKSDTSSQSETNPDIEAALNLQDHLRNRAGTVQRCYRGGAYRIRTRPGGSDFMYVLAEGATPVLTFQEAYKSGTETADLMKSHRVDIVSNFYQTLKILIQENIDCRDLVDLIYYDDTQNANVVPLLRKFLLENQ